MDGRDANASRGEHRRRGERLQGVRRRLATGLALGSTLLVALGIAVLVGLASGCDPDRCGSGECEGIVGCCSCTLNDVRGQCAAAPIAGRTCTAVWDFTGMCGCCAYCCQ